MDELFKGRHFDREIIVLCVRWHLRYKLSFRDLVEMMAERGLSLVHTTIMRWIQRYVPEFEKRWNRFARPAGRSWRVDETYVKIKGRWTYLYRAVDFLLRAKRDVAAAKAFFRRAFRGQDRLPRKITLDGYQASHRAVNEVLNEHRAGNHCKIRSSKYLNNLIEQDHRSIKLRLGPMLGFKHFRRAATTIAGIELMHRIRKGQFTLGTLHVKSKTVPEIWNAVLAAFRVKPRAPARFDFQGLHHNPFEDLVKVFVVGVHYVGEEDVRRFAAKFQRYRDDVLGGVLHD
jgi:transposase-like protein